MLVGPPANFPDLTATTSQGANITHLDHRRREIGVKAPRIVAVTTYYGVGGAAVEELLVGMEETSLSHEVLEVVVVKRSRRGDVEWS